MILSYLLFFYFIVNQQNIPLGCIEDENKILLNWPFFSIASGRKIRVQEVCEYKPSLRESIMKGISPINNIKIKLKNSSIIVAKDKSNIKKFYSTDNLSPYPGLLLGNFPLTIDNTIYLYLRQIKGDGLFLLVIRKEKTILARQVIIEGRPICNIEIKVPVTDFFEIPYYKKGFVEDRYQLELYLINYNPMSYEITGLEIR